MSALKSEQVLKWFGEDSIEEIAQYIASNLNNIRSGSITIDQFINSIKSGNSDEAIEAIKTHFALNDKEIKDNTDEYAEQYAIKIGDEWHGIEVCHTDSETVKDLGADCFSNMNDTFVWRWL